MPMGHWDGVAVRLSQVSLFYAFLIGMPYKDTHHQTSWSVTKLLEPQILIIIIILWVVLCFDNKTQTFNFGGSLDVMFQAFALPEPSTFSYD